MQAGASSDDTVPDRGQAAPPRGATERWLETGVQATIALLVVSMLVQKPLVELGEVSTSVSIRSWDVAWALFGVLALPWLWLQRRRLRELIRSADLPLKLLVAFVALSVISLSWGYINFGTSEILECAIRAMRLSCVALLAVTLTLLLDDARARRLTFLVIAAATIAAIWASGVWLTSERLSASGNGSTVTITRAGGPFGNMFADGTPDLEWADAAGANSLGFWIAAAMAAVSGVLFWAARPGHRSLLTIAGMAVLLGVLFVGLLATHSRESWLAAAAACALVFGLAWPKLDNRVRWGVAAAAPAITVVVLLAVPSLNARIERIFEEPSTHANAQGARYGLATQNYPALLGIQPYNPGANSRYTSWESGLEWGVESYGVGWGLGEIEEHPQYFGGPTAENVFIQQFAQIGILGMLLLVALCAAGIREALRRLNGRLVPLAILFALSFFATFVVHGMFGNTLGDPSIQILFACSVGILGATTTGARSTTG